MRNWTGPAWLTCLGGIVQQRMDDLADMDEDDLLSESYRVEIDQPPSEYNDRDWRNYRRLVRQEMHSRGLTTPTEKPLF